MHPEEMIVLDRRRLKLGKYTRWAASFSDEEVYGLLWFLGEFGIRTSEYNLGASIQEVGRARTGLLAMKAIRNAYKTTPPTQDLNQTSHD
jgi:hypothetical protein